MSVQKTFDAIAVTPLSFRQIVLGEILWATTKACLSGLVILIVFAIAGLIKSPWAPLILVLCFIEGILFASLGMLATSLAKSYEFFTYYFTLFISPMFLFSGTFFPLQGLSKYLTGLAWFLPLTHAVKGARAICSGHFGLAFWGAIAWLLVVGSLICWLAVRRMEKRLYV
jgi:lipooligosaccharide transport system permease protein